MNIAVLLSTYNGSKYLDEQLKSLKNQTVANMMKVYIRDDASNDDTSSIIKRWETKLNIELISGKNLGPAMSFWELLCNTSIEADYYLFADQDDVWDKDKIEKSIFVLKDDVHLSICNCRIINSYGDVVKKKRVMEIPKISLQRLFVAGIAQGCSMAFTRELRDYIISLKLKCIPMHDIILMIYALNYGRIIWIDKPLFGYRVHENNVVAKENKSLIKKIKTSYWNWKNSSVNSMADVASELILNRNNFSQDELYFLEAMSKYRGSIKNKKKVIMDDELRGIDKKILRSYKIRVILGLL